MNVVLRHLSQYQCTKIVVVVILLLSYHIKLSWLNVKLLKSTINYYFKQVMYSITMNIFILKQNLFVKENIVDFCFV